MLSRGFISAPHVESVRDSRFVPKNTPEKVVSVEKCNQLSDSLDVGPRAWFEGLWSNSLTEPKQIEGQRLDGGLL